MNLSSTDFINFIKAIGSPLIHLVNFSAISFSLWMIWGMRNFTKFQQAIA